METITEAERQKFTARYGASASAAMIEVEREALGSDYQANGYATRTQVDELGVAVGLRPGDRLLDVGAGCGWPGLYLAQRHGCAVVSLDPVALGAHASVSRAHHDGLAHRHLAVCAGAVELPFRRGAFDAIVHVDVMC